MFPQDLLEKSVVHFHHTQKLLFNFKPAYKMPQLTAQYNSIYKKQFLLLAYYKKIYPPQCSQPQHW